MVIISTGTYYQPTKLISAQVVFRYLLTRNMLNESIRKYPKDIYYSGFFSQNFEIIKNFKQM